MADEFDRKYLPELLQDTFVISLGACHKSIEMMKDPQTSAEKIFSEMKILFTIPNDEGLQKKAESFAATWMEKMAGLMEDCKNAGLKFTEEAK
jgi:hypothetical protein